MRLFLIFIAFIAFINDNCHAQISGAFRINLFTPGIGYELPISPKNYISLDFDYAPNSFIARNVTLFSLFPRASIEYSYYLNLEKREKRGLNTSYGSGNFLFTGVDIMSSYGTIVIYEKSQKSSYLEKQIGIVIPLGFGIQRNIGKNFQFSAKAGFYFVPEIQDISPILKLRISYLLTKNNLNEKS